MTSDQQHESGTARRVPSGEWAIAVGLIAIGVVVLRDGLAQNASRSASGVGAGFMPTVVGALIIALALALCAQIARGRLGKPDTGEGDLDVSHSRWLPLGATVTAGLVFIGGVETLGYVPTSTVVFWLVAWAVGARRHTRSLGGGLGLSLAVYLSFTRLLDIPLPAGLLEGVL